MKGPAQLMEPNDVVRLTGYRWKSPNSEDRERTRNFAAAWREAAEADRSHGVIYRELCEKLSPARTDAATTDFDFIEYALLSPDADIPALKSFRSHDAPECETSESKYRVDFRLMKESATAPAAVMFRWSEFQGPVAIGRGFIMSWPGRTSGRLQEPGFLTGVMHETLILGEPLTALERFEFASIPSDQTSVPTPAMPFVLSQGTVPPRPATPRGVEGVYRIAAAVAGQRPPPKAMMKAVRLHGYGGPEVLVYEDAPRPVPAAGQILVRVRAATINHLDLMMRKGIMKFGFPPWFPDILGHALSGTVEAVGSGVTHRQIGENVYGTIGPLLRHAYADYIVASESLFHPKPDNFSFIEASACVSFLATAYGALFTRTPLRRGQRILIHGGAGAVGGYAIQLAKRVGAFVIATASTQNLPILRELGADVVIDYKTQRFEDACDPLVDFVLDTMGGDTRERSWPLLNRGGVLATLMTPPPDERRAVELGVQAFMVFGHPDAGQILPEMTHLLETGELRRPLIAQVFPLQEATAAHAYMEKQPIPGRVVLITGDKS